MRLLGLSLLMAVLLLACRKDSDDETDPQVVTFEVDGMTSDVSIAAGQTYQIHVAFTDNEALQQCRIHIYDLFKNNTEYSLLRVYDLQGTSDELTLTFDMPSDASSGPYELEVVVVDANGNSSEAMILPIAVTQSGQPVVVITAPDVSQVLYYNEGDTLQISGTATDDEDLETITYTIEDDGVNLLSYAASYPDSVVTTFDLAQLATDSLWMIIPSSTSGDTLEFHITAADSTGNYTRSGTTLLIN